MLLSRAMSSDRPFARPSTSGLMTVAAAAAAVAADKPPSPIQQQSESTKPSSSITTPMPGKTKPGIVPPSKDGIESFTSSDVLSGRGGGTNLHPGNRHYRDLIFSSRKTYEASSKARKPHIARKIVQQIRENGGRFLLKDSSNGLYYEIGDLAAREKTSQALRHRTFEMRRKEEADRMRALIKKRDAEWFAGRDAAASSATDVKTEDAVTETSDGASSARMPVPTRTTSQCTHQKVKSSAASSVRNPVKKSKALDAITRKVRKSRSDRGKESVVCNKADGSDTDSLHSAPSPVPAAASPQAPACRVQSNAADPRSAGFPPHVYVPTMYSGVSLVSGPSSIAHASRETHSQQYEHEESVKSTSKSPTSSADLQALLKFGQEQRQRALVAEQRAVQLQQQLQLQHYHLQHHAALLPHGAILATNTPVHSRAIRHATLVAAPHAALLHGMQPPTFMTAAPHQPLSSMTMPTVNSVPHPSILIAAEQHRRHQLLAAAADIHGSDHRGYHQQRLQHQQPTGSARSSPSTVDKYCG